MTSFLQGLLRTDQSYVKDDVIQFSNVSVFPQGSNTGYSLVIIKIFTYSISLEFIGWVANYTVK